MAPSRASRPPAPSPRRAPQPEDRQRDPARTRQRILDAALEEFGAKGFGGARVADIATRAGVNQQLISYYFGGKQGLYEELTRAWYANEAVIADPERSYAAMVAGYLDATLDRPAGARMWLRQGLDEAAAPDVRFEPGAGGDGAPGDPAADVEAIRERQRNGELTDAFDPEFILLVMMAATVAPIALPDVARGSFGLESSSPEFRERYLAQLVRLFAAPEPETPADATPADGVAVERPPS